MIERMEADGGRRMKKVFKAFVFKEQRLCSEKKVPMDLKETFLEKSMMSIIPYGSDT